MSETLTPQRTLSKKDLLLEKKHAIEQKLRAIATKETTAKRKAETKGKIILGGLLLANRREIIPELAKKASPKDLEHLKALGLL